MKQITVLFGALMSASSFAFIGLGSEFATLTFTDVSEFQQIAIKPSRTVAIGKSGSSLLIQEIDHDGNFRSQQFYRPARLETIEKFESAVDAAGNLYVAMQLDSNIGRVIQLVKFEASTLIVDYQSRISASGSALALAVTGTGTAYVGGQSNSTTGLLAGFAPNGVLSFLQGVGSVVNDLAYDDANSTLWVAGARNGQPLLQQRVGANVTEYIDGLNGSFMQVRIDGNIAYGFGNYRPPSDSYQRYVVYRVQSQIGTRYRVGDYVAQIEDSIVDAKLGNGRAFLSVGARVPPALFSLNLQTLIAEFASLSQGTNRMAFDDRIAVISDRNVKVTGSSTLDGPSTELPPGYIGTDIRKMPTRTGFQGVGYRSMFDSSGAETRKAAVFNMQRDDGRVWYAETLGGSSSRLDTDPVLGASDENGIIYRCLPSQFGSDVMRRNPDGSQPWRVRFPHRVTHIAANAQVLAVLGTFKSGDFNEPTPILWFVDPATGAIRSERRDLTFAGTDHGIMNALAVDPQGRVFVAGEAIESLGGTLAPPYRIPILSAFLAASNQLLWRRSVTSIVDGTFSSVKPHDSSVYVAVDRGNEGAFLYKYNVLFGDLEWSRGLPFTGKPTPPVIGSGASPRVFVAVDGSMGGNALYALSVANGTIVHSMSRGATGTNLKLTLSSSGIPIIGYQDGTSTVVSRWNPEFGAVNWTVSHPDTQLAELMTDQSGRLLMLGARGVADSENGLTKVSRINRIDEASGATLQFREGTVQTAGIDIVPDGMVESTPGVLAIFGRQDVPGQSVGGYLERVQLPIAPVAVPDAYMAFRNIPLFIPAIRGVLANDTDLDQARPFGAIMVSNVPTAAGSVLLLGDGSFVYLPRRDFRGHATFRYRTQDATNLASAPTTVTIKVN